MRDIRFTPMAFEQYNEWLSVSKTIYTRLQKLIIETARTPFVVTGKPGPLKHELKGFWSRRINDEHRLVYAVEPDSIVIIACRMHYEN